MRGLSVSYRTPLAVTLLVALASGLFFLFVATADARPGDRDNDGLSDRFEQRRSHTSPRRADTDRDGLRDGAELRRRKTNPRKWDTDGDGLGDGAELFPKVFTSRKALRLPYGGRRLMSSDPRRRDTDGDGLSDSAERSAGTNPRLRDTDGDGLSDSVEVRRYRTDPLDATSPGRAFSPPAPPLPPSPPPVVELPPVVPPPADTPPDDPPPDNPPPDDPPPVDPPPVDPPPVDPSPDDPPPPPDTTAPQTTINSGPDSSTTSTAATFSFSSSEDGSTFSCRLDSGSWGNCVSPRSYTGLAVGAHTFRVRATDAAGNTDQSSASRNWTVVAPPPPPPPPDPEPDPDPDPEPPPPGTCDATATSASALRSAVLANAGKTVCVSGNVGNVNLASARPAQTVTIAQAPAGGQLGTLDMTKAANITVSGIRLRAASISGDSSARAQSLTFRDCQAGGTSSSSRLVVFAVFDIRAYSRDILISGCDIGWTGQGGADNGYGVRAVNGDAGPIETVTVEKSRIHHITADGVQLAGAKDFTLDRSEISYAATEPNGPDTHADSIQVMSSSGAARFTGNYIHHTGYYSDTQIPSAAGQWIMHEWVGGSTLVENNLIVDNRNYAPAFSGVPSNVTLRRNTILRNGTAFGSSADDLQWSAGSGTNRRMEENIIGGCGCGSTITYAGNVWIDQGAHGSSDIRLAVQFDANMEPTNLPSSHASAGYRKPSGAPW